MGINTYNTHAVREFGDGMKMHWLRFHLGRKQAHQKQVPSGTERMVKLDIFLNMGVFAMLFVIVR